MSHDCTNETCRRPTCLPCVTFDLEAARTCMFEAERQLAEERQEVELKSACIAGMRRDLDEMEKKWATAVAFGCVIESERDSLTAELERVRADRSALEREVERWRHGVTIEGDFVCPNEFNAVTLRAELERVRAERDVAVSSCQQNSTLLFQARQERDAHRSALAVLDRLLRGK